MRILFSLPLGLAAATAAVPANAAYLMQLSEVGGAVTATGSGSLNLTALNGRAGGSGGNSITPSQGLLFTGNTGRLDLYTGISGSESFGPGQGTTQAAGNTGDALGIWGARGFLWVSQGYVSGTAFTSLSTFRDTTFAGLGVTPGTYTYTWGTGATADRLTVQIGPVTGAGVPEPAAWAMMIGGFGLVGGALRRRTGTVRPRVRFA